MRYPLSFISHIKKQIKNKEPLFIKAYIENYFHMRKIIKQNNKKLKQIVGNLQKENTTLES